MKFFCLNFQQVNKATHMYTYACETASLGVCRIGTMQCNLEQ